jgi:hypothetical protein
MNKKIIIIPLIFALTLSGLFELSYAGDSAIIEVRTENIYLTAGQENTITIQLKNTGDYKVFDIELFLSSSTENINILSNANKVINEIEAHKTKSYEATVYVDQNSPLGAYNLLLEVNYGRSGSTLSHRLSVSIGVIVWETYKPKIAFTTDQENLKVKAGTEKQFNLSFTNQWNKEIHNLELVINSQITGITILNQVSSEYAAVNTSESIIFSPRISVLQGIPLGTYSLSISAMYNDEEGHAHHQKFTVPILVDEAKSFQTTIVTISEAKTLQEKILPGNTVDLELTYLCGKADAYDVISILTINQSPTISPISPTTISLGNIPKDETEQATYKLLINGDAAAGQYPVTVTVMYTDSKGVTKTLSETITILVDGLIEFELLDVPTLPVYLAESHEIEADILLIGTESVQFVSIGLVDDEVFERIPGSDEYIGAVDPDSPIPFDIRYKISEEAEPGIHTMNLKVRYRDHLNKPHEISLDLEIELSQDLEPDSRSENRGGFWQWLRNLFR